MTCKFNSALLSCRTRLGTWESPVLGGMSAYGVQSSFCCIFFGITVCFRVRIHDYMKVKNWQGEAKIRDRLQKMKIINTEKCIIRSN